MDERGFFNQKRDSGFVMVCFWCKKYFICKRLWIFRK